MQTIVETNFPTSAFLRTCDCRNADKRWQPQQFITGYKFRKYFQPQRGASLSRRAHRPSHDPSRGAAVIGWTPRSISSRHSTGCSNTSSSGFQVREEGGGQQGLWPGLCFLFPGGWFGDCVRDNLKVNVTDSAATHSKIMRSDIHIVPTLGLKHQQCGTCGYTVGRLQ